MNTWCVELSRTCRALPALWLVASLMSCWVGCSDAQGGPSDSDAGSGPDGDVDGGAIAPGDGGDGDGDGCRMTRREDRMVVTVSMSDDGREVFVERAGVMEHHSFDERGLWVRQELSGGSPARAPLELSYDEQGHLVSAEEFGTPGNQCTNEYDADDRITRRQCTQQGTHEYRYDTEGRIDQVTVTFDDSPLINEVRYDGDGAEPVAYESPDALYTYAYDDDGRMLQRERDWVFGGGKDGTPDIRWTWQRDDSGAVTRYAQDGTDHNDAPVIDGSADLLWSFSEACAEIVLEHPWLTGEDAVFDVGQPMPPFPG